MKKVLIALPAVICVVLFLIWSKSSPIAPNSTVQPVDETVGITLLDSTIPVEAAIERQVKKLLAVDAPIRSVFVYAITDVVDKNGYYTVSVAGLPIGSNAMHLGDAVWLGSVQLAKMPGLPGLVTDLMSSQPTDNMISVKEGRGGAGNILPFRSGTQAQYGISAVHNCGYSLNGWKAVDLFPAENMVYSSLSGEVNYVCRDTTQIALRIGDNLYTHLVDNDAQVGDQYSQGQAISGMVSGAFDDTCGVSDQGESAYHVHFCFLPDATGFYHADGYALNTATGSWTKTGGDTVNPLGYLTADWANAGIIPGPAAGANIWDSTVSGVTSMVDHTAAILPVHVDLKMADTVLGNAGPAFDLMYTVVLANFDLTVPLWVIGIITVLEIARIGYASWMWVKRAIPIIG